MIVELALAAAGGNGNNNEILIALGTGSAGLVSGIAGLGVGFSAKRNIDRHKRESEKADPPPAA